MRRILFVAMQNSIHVARWVRQIADRGWDLHLFPVNNEPPHEELAGVTIHWPMMPLRPRVLLRAIRQDPRRILSPFAAERALYPNVRYRAVRPLPMVKLPAAARRLLPGKLGTVAPAGGQGTLDPFSPATLARVIRHLRPDLVHSMEFQHASYRVLRAKDAFGPGFPPWLATNWGSDLYFYRHLPDHRAMIERLLGAIDFYSCECRRDVDIARELGLAAPALPVFPNTGGFDLQEIGRCNSGPPSRRRLLMVKGYQHFAGRAMTALDAVERCRDLLAGYELVVFSASYDVRDRVDAMARDGWNIRAPGYCRHDEMLALFGRARCYLGVNISDAISTSLLESMAMGAFPIQTNTSCCDEWIVDGESGFSIPPDDLETIVARLRRALTDDALVDAAAERNAVTVRERLDARILAAKAAAMYEGVFAAIGGQSGALAAG